MARIKLELPEAFAFETLYKIRIQDINYGNHLGNDAVLSIMHEARLSYLKSLGLKNELDLEGSIGLMVTDVAIVYKSEGFHGEELTIKVVGDDFNKYGFDLFYLLKKADGKELARGKTGMICYDYEAKKLAHIPPKFEELLKQGI